MTDAKDKPAPFYPIDPRPGANKTPFRFATALVLGRADGSMEARLEKGMCVTVRTENGREYTFERDDDQSSEKVEVREKGETCNVWTLPPDLAAKLSSFGDEFSLPFLVRATPCDPTTYAFAVKEMVSRKETPTDRTEEPTKREDAIRGEPEKGETSLPNLVDDAPQGDPILASYVGSTSFVYRDSTRLPEGAKPWTRTSENAKPFSTLGMLYDTLLARCAKTPLQSVDMDVPSIKTNWVSWCGSCRYDICEVAASDEGACFNHVEIVSAAPTAREGRGQFPTVRSIVEALEPLAKRNRDAAVTLDEHLLQFTGFESPGMLRSEFVGARNGYVVFWTHAETKDMLFKDTLFNRYTPMSDEIVEDIEGLPAEAKGLDKLPELLGSRYGVCDDVYAIPFDDGPESRVWLGNQRAFSKKYPGFPLGTLVHDRRAFRSLPITADGSHRRDAVVTRFHFGTLRVSRFLVEHMVRFEHTIDPVAEYLSELHREPVAE